MLHHAGWEPPRFDGPALVRLRRGVWRYGYGLGFVKPGFKMGCLGPSVVPFYPFFGGGSPTKTDYGKKGTLIQNLSTGGPRMGCGGIRLGLGWLPTTPGSPKCMWAVHWGARMGDHVFNAHYAI